MALTLAAWLLPPLPSASPSAVAPHPPLTPNVPINIIGPSGDPVRNDNRTSFSRVGNGNGTTPPEQYVPYHPGSPSDTTPISRGETVIFRNVHTGLWCRLAPFSGAGTGSTQCNTQGVLCDKGSMADATTITYEGTGLSYNGVPLVQLPGSGTLVLSSDASCSVPGGDSFEFPPGKLHRRLLCSCRCCSNCHWRCTRHWPAVLCRHLAAARRSVAGSSRLHVQCPALQVLSWRTVLVACRWPCA